MGVVVIRARKTDNKHVNITNDNKRKKAIRRKTLVTRKGSSRMVISNIDKQIFKYQLWN